MWTRSLIALIAGTVFAGCVANDPMPADVRFKASWQPWQDDNIPHLILTVTNMGGETAYIGPGGREITVSGPAGLVPIDWGGTTFSRPVFGGASVIVGFHPRLINGLFGLAIDHAHPLPVDPPSGPYLVCLDQDCTRAELGAR